MFLNIGGIIGGAAIGEPYNPRPLISWLIKYFKNIPEETKKNKKENLGEATKKASQRIQTSLQRTFDEFPTDPRKAACPYGAIQKEENVKLIPEKKAKKYSEILNEENVKNWEKIKDDLGIAHCNWNIGNTEKKVFIDDGGGYLKLTKKNNKITGEYLNITKQ